MKRITAVVVVTDADPPGTPCGACRQWMAEFGDDTTSVITANLNGAVRRFTLGELLPEAFRLQDGR
jgi:cytidine deaminase